MAAARAGVLAARDVVDEELVRLEASARAAVDFPAKVRRSPAKAAGIAAGAGFLLVGGPAKLFRRAKRAVLGPSEPLPASMLPKEVDAVLSKLGADGERVRGTIEREFANYLEETAPKRKERNLGGALAALALTAGRPVAMRAGKQFVERMLAPGAPGFEEQLAKIRQRTAAVTEANTSTASETPEHVPPA